MIYLIGIAAALSAVNVVLYLVSMNRIDSLCEEIDSLYVEEGHE